jgi:hypothetical protein
MALNIRKTVCRDIIRKNWQAVSLKVAPHLPRWYNHLSPDINSADWSEKDEERLFEAHKEFGNKWKIISRLFEGR